MGCGSSTPVARTTGPPGATILPAPPASFAAVGVDDGARTATTVETVATAVAGDSVAMGMFTAALWSHIAEDVVSALASSTAPPQISAPFARFLRSHFSIQGLQFLTDLDALAGMEAPEAISDHIQYILDTYIEPDSCRCVNLSSRVRTSLCTDGEHDFAQARSEILQLLATDCMPRFLRSPQCLELEAALQAMPAATWTVRGHHFGTGMSAVSPLYTRGVAREAFAAKRPSSTASTVADSTSSTPATTSPLAGALHLSRPVPLLASGAPLAGVPLISITPDGVQLQAGAAVATASLDGSTDASISAVTVEQTAVIACAAAGGSDSCVGGAASALDAAAAAAKPPVHSVKPVPSSLTLRVRATDISNALRIAFNRVDEADWLTALQSVGDLLPLSLVLVDMREVGSPITFVNDAFCCLSGYDKRDVLGRNCRFLQGEGTEPEAIEQLRDAIRSAREVSVVLTNYRKDGTPFRNLVTMKPVFDVVRPNTRALPSPLPGRHAAQLAAVTSQRYCVHESLRYFIGLQLELVEDHIDFDRRAKLRALIDLLPSVLTFPLAG